MEDEERKYACAQASSLVSKEMERILEEMGERKEYDQNILYVKTFFCCYF